ncbi:glutathione S-transferase N-terminal domain-containing protein [Chitinibacter fontanus]|uniref:Glutathione S-transferase N-terminal domain-containing protein n=1 Tax=Chitinibacter fontanus TaxID=1737446 RepID=A0A7D5ZDP8_9NEIS|nr:glutathione S-transferase N-terminal domain-containing protein [Chitinibacter fontanus]QLI80568.1 glutathione S-transferase N-terminal domain-containing protein [Chitinibacter fontanus]
MTQTALPILYSFRRCPYAIRARMAIYLSGVSVQLREVVLRDKPAELLAASTKGTVPVLVLPVGAVLDQSLDIMLWALRQHDPMGILKRDLDYQLQLIAEHDLQFKPLLDRYKYPERFPELAAEEHQYHAMYWLKENIEKRLEIDTPSFESKITLSDLAIMPFIRQCAAVDPRVFQRLASPTLQSWLATFCAGELFTAVMDKYPTWQTGTEGIPFGRST